MNVRKEDIAKIVLTIEQIHSVTKRIVNVVEKVQKEHEEFKSIVWSAIKLLHKKIDALDGWVTAEMNKR